MSIIEVATYAALPAMGIIGESYITADTNFIYIWSGSAYTKVGKAISTEYYDNIITKINSFTDMEEQACQELDKYIQQLTATLKKQLIKLLKEMASYAELIISPTDIESIITWINKVIKKIEGPYVVMAIDYAILMNKYAELLETIENVSNGLQCNLTIPSAPTTDELTDAIEEELA